MNAAWLELYFLFVPSIILGWVTTPNIHSHAYIPILAGHSIRASADRVAAFRTAAAVAAVGARDLSSGRLLAQLHPGPTDEDIFVQDISC